MTPDRRPRKRTRLDAAQRRKQILDEAMRLVGRRGYHGFSIQELAQRCKLTNAGLLYYFGSKERLLIELLEDRERRDTTAVTSATGLQRESVDRLSLEDVRQVFHEIIARNVSQPDIVRLFNVLASEALDPGHPAHDYFRKREARVLGSFASMLAPHVPEPELTARELLALIFGLESQWLRAGQGFDLLGAWDKAAAMVLPPAALARRSRTGLRR